MESSFSDRSSSCRTFSTPSAAGSPRDWSPSPRSSAAARFARTEPRVGRAHASRRGGRGTRARRGRRLGTGDPVEDLQGRPAAAVCDVRRPARLPEPGGRNGEAGGQPAAGEGTRSDRLALPEPRRPRWVRRRLRGRRRRGPGDQGAAPALRPGRVRPPRHQPEHAQHRVRARRPLRPSLRRRPGSAGNRAHGRRRAARGPPVRGELPEAQRRPAPFMGTEYAARDMDLLRAAVGDDQLSYLGLSYGTYLGAVYADMFPTRVRAVAVDGTVDPFQLRRRLPRDPGRELPRQRAVRGRVPRLVQRPRLRLPLREGGRRGRPGRARRAPRRPAVDQERRHQGGDDERLHRAVSPLPAHGIGTRPWPNTGKLLAEIAAGNPVITNPDLLGTLRWRDQHRHRVHRRGRQPGPCGLRPLRPSQRCHGAAAGAGAGLRAAQL